MAVSCYKTILDQFAAQIQTLGLTLNGTALSVAVRKLPKKEETLDTTPLICVAPSDKPESVEPFSTENEALVKYKVEVVIIVSGDGDYTATNLDSELNFRQLVRRQFQWLLANFSYPRANLFKIDGEHDAPLDRDNLNNLYDYSGLGFRCHVVEPALASQSSP